ncbi:hypothetical protein [Pseudobacteriovorax antillogorgiicola]|uniref:Uncharacterized protein n=1 Tax=Pseudobacteriovorax antillogorgiicola TaxID=1513793 RepID=A0A1Y6CP64_9BACT|nr:hypothetical protein [Pseudobacteriovorax antillogorgiicola]TCS46674.1 hypothetical protein EDD56_12350 [Pseudobacteriovorax antillogorgiicola]SMF66654.1 hypothetical protein SAMN06296036_12350 [Pseudobacteriovorax antillogorgiicola]
MFVGSIHIRKIISVISVSLGVLSCTTDEKFPSIDNRIAGPVDVATSGQYSFVLNSDFDRNYNTGSILTLDLSQEAGSEKVGTHKVPRMGRSIFTRSSLMIATFDRTALDGNGSVEIYTIGSDGSLVTNVSQELECSPINGIISSSSTWAVVSCLGGEIYVASINSSDVGATSFKKVRDYAYARRAMYIYETSTDDYLLAFPTDFGEQTQGDYSAIDKLSLDINLANNANSTTTTITVDGENEIPDNFEASLAAIRTISARYPFQMAILNLSEAERNDFPLKEMGSVTDKDETKVIEVDGSSKTVYRYANNELKFLYFFLDKLAGQAADIGDGTTVTDVAPEDVASQTDGIKYYRTNFWEVQETDDSKVIYLSHRGVASNGSTDANNILKFNILDDGSVFDLPDPTTLADDAEGGFTKSFKEMFQVKRVMGFTSLARTGYPGDFGVAKKGSNEFVFVNQFRDEAYWSASDLIYAIDAKRIDGAVEPDFPIERWAGVDYRQSAYQLAILEESGSPSKIISCSFYGDSVLVFDIDAEKGIDVTQEPTAVF